MLIPLYWSWLSSISRHSVVMIMNISACLKTEDTSRVSTRLHHQSLLLAAWWTQIEIPDDAPQLCGVCDKAVVARKRSRVIIAKSSVIITWPWVCINCDIQNHYTVLCESTMSTSNSFSRLSHWSEKLQFGPQLNDGFISSMKCGIQGIHLAHASGHQFPDDALQGKSHYWRCYIYICTFVL